MGPKSVATASMPTVPTSPQFKPPTTRSTAATTSSFFIGYLTIWSVFRILSTCCLNIINPRSAYVKALPQEILDRRWTTRHLHYYEFPLRHTRTHHFATPHRRRRRADRTVAGCASRLGTPISGGS